MSSPKHSPVKAILRATCAAYTVIVLFLCLVLLFTSDNADRTVSPLNFLLVLPFSLVFSVANYVDRETKLHPLPKSLLHFLLTVGGFFCFLYLPAFPNQGESSSLVVFGVFTLLYLIVYGLVLLFRFRLRKELRLESDYTPQFQGEEGSRNRGSRSRGK